MSRVPNINNKKDLRSVLSAVIENSQDLEELDSRKKLKTYLIESNFCRDDSKIEMSGVILKETSDPSLKILIFEYSKKSYVKFYLDVEDKRFWQLHSVYDATLTESFIRNLIEKTGSRLDYIWMPSNMLEDYMKSEKNNGFGIKFKNKLFRGDDSRMKDISMRFWGSDAYETVNDLRKSSHMTGGLSLSSIGITHYVENGYTKENITNHGKITVMKGNSVDCHFGIVEKIKNQYSETLNLIESEYRIKYTRHNSGIKLSGAPLYIDFSKSLEDIKRLADIMTSSKVPFRIFGITQDFSDSFIRINGIDLHTNDLVNFEITPDWMSIYLNENSCGNVVTRLLTNIQTHVSSDVKLSGDNAGRII